MSGVIRKRELDRQVSVLLGKKRSAVSLVTEAFLKELSELIAAGEIVRLDGFGVLQLTVRKGHKVGLTLCHMKKGQKPEKTTIIQVEKKYYVTFKQAVPLKALIREKQGPATKKVSDMESVAFSMVPSTDGTDEGSD